MVKRAILMFSLVFVEQCTFPLIYHYCALYIPYIIQKINQTSPIHWIIYAKLKGGAVSPFQKEKFEDAKETTRDQINTTKLKRKKYKR